MVIEVNSIPETIIKQTKDTSTENSTAVRERVIKAYNKQMDRNGKTNCDLNAGEIDELCQLNTVQKELLQMATKKLGLSGRGIHRILKVARTIADLAESESIETHHLSEAISYRQKLNDRQTIYT